jgi:hypothetical protein
MRAVLEQLIPVIVVLLGCVAWALFIFIRSNASLLTKFTSVPAAIIGAFVVVFYVITWLGKSVPMPLPDEINVIAHQTIVKNSKKTSIEIWVKESTSTRLYIIPYSKEMEGALKGAEQGRQQGLESHLKKKKKKQQKQDGAGEGGQKVPDQAQSPYELKLLQPSDIVPKNGPLTPGQEQQLDQQEQEQPKPDSKYTT